AAQERQDAVLELIRGRPDVMVGSGGHNSSNTTHVAAIRHEKVTTFHIEDAGCIDAAAGTIRFRPVGAKVEERREEWLPQGPLTIDRKSTRLNSSHGSISYAVFCLKKKKKKQHKNALH